MSKRRILSLRQFMEDMPTNNAGGGQIDGIGVGPKGEPGGKKFILNKKLLRRKKVK